MRAEIMLDYGVMSKTNWIIYM